MDTQHPATDRHVKNIENKRNEFSNCWGLEIHTATKILLTLTFTLILYSISLRFNVLNRGVIDIEEGESCRRVIVSICCPFREVLLILIK